MLTKPTPCLQTPCVQKRSFCSQIFDLHAQPTALQTPCLQIYDLQQKLRFCAPNYVRITNPLHGLQIFDLQASQKRSFCAQAAAQLCCACKPTVCTRRVCTQAAAQPTAVQGVGFVRKGFVRKSKIGKPSAVQSRAVQGACTLRLTKN